MYLQNRIMKKTERFNLPNVGTFQSLTCEQLKKLSKYEHYLPDMPTILFIKTGWSLKKRPALLKSELHVKLKNALEKMKN